MRYGRARNAAWKCCTAYTVETPRIMCKKCMQARPSGPQLGRRGNQPQDARPSRQQYLAAVAEFDGLWNTSSSAVARDRMEQLLGVIVAFEEGSGKHPA